MPPRHTHRPSMSGSETPSDAQSHASDDSHVFWRRLALQERLALDSDYNSDDSLPNAHRQTAPNHGPALFTAALAGQHAQPMCAPSPEPEMGHTPQPFAEPPTEPEAEAAHNLQGPPDNIMFTPTHEPAGFPTEPTMGYGGSRHGWSSSGDVTDSGKEDITMHQVSATAGPHHHWDVTSSSTSCAASDQGETPRPSSLGLAEAMPESPPSPSEGPSPLFFKNDLDPEEFKRPSAPQLTSNMFSQCHQCSFGNS